MKLLRVLFGLGIFELAVAVSQQVRVYTFDSSDISSPTRDPVSVDLATLVLAQRLGLSETLSLNVENHKSVIDEDVFATLRQLGGKQRPLLGERAREKTSKLLVIIEGVAEDPFAGFAQNGQSLDYFTISGDVTLIQSQLLPPSINYCGYEFEGVDGLYGRYGYQREDWPLKTMEYGSACRPRNPRLDNIERMSEYLKSLRGMKDLLASGLSNIAAPGAVGIFRVPGPESAAEYDQAISILKELVEPFRVLAKNGQQETSIMVIPGEAKDLKKDGKHKTTKKSRAIHEKILSGGSSTVASVKSKMLSSNAVSQGVISLCHSSYNACVSATNNCTDHGSCYLKYSIKEGDSTAQNCYACGCVASSWANPDGTKKSIAWGGSACQKKDISMPFFLLTGFTVVMTGAVIWAIGLMFSMGNEELPSVIGAGVAVPKGVQK